MSKFCSAICVIVLGVVVYVVFEFIPGHRKAQEIVRLDSTVTYLNQHAPQFQENYQKFLDNESYRDQAYTNNRIYLDKGDIKRNNQVVFQLKLCSYVVDYAEWIEEGVIGTKTLSANALATIISPKFKFFCAL